MEKKVLLGDKEVLYTLRKSKRTRCIRLVVHNNGSVIVTTPYGFFREAVAEKFIREKSLWILSKIAYYEQSFKKANTQFNGKSYPKHKAEAYQFVTKRIEYLNTFYTFKFNCITIRNQKTRWGSCSKQGNLNFNFKIAFLPPQLADYIIVHELCHLKELNHSSRFWALVARAFPNYKQIRKELRQYNLNVG